MPGHDKTGPLGDGPLTGKRLGLCTGNETTEAGNATWNPFRQRGRLLQEGGRGYGFGQRLRFGRRGGGRRQGFGRGIGFQKSVADQLSSNNPDIKEEIDFIKNQLKALENQLSKLVKKEEAE